MRLPFWRKPQRQMQLEQEIQSHVQMKASDRVGRGESAERAQQAARRWMDGTMYIPYGPLATVEEGPVPAEMTLIVRSAANQHGLEESLRRLASSLNEDVPVAEVKPMTLILADAVSAPRAVTSLFSAFAALALVLGSLLVSEREKSASA